VDRSAEDWSHELLKTEREWVDLEKTGVDDLVKTERDQWIDLQNTEVDELVKTGFIQLVLVVTHLLHTFLDIIWKLGLAHSWKTWRNKFQWNSSRNMFLM
jgi:hypothetical protein